jgi:hypothetical protein
MTNYWQASQISGVSVELAPLGAAGVKVVSLEVVVWRMRVAGRERR